MMKSSSVLASILFYILAYYSLCVFGRPATFAEDFRVTWSDSHIRQIEGGRAIQLVLDQNSGNVFIFYFFSLLVGST